MEGIKSVNTKSFSGYGLYSNTKDAKHLSIIQDNKKIILQVLISPKIRGSKKDIAFYNIIQRELLSLSLVILLLRQLLC